MARLFRAITLIDGANRTNVHMFSLRQSPLARRAALGVLGCSLIALVSGCVTAEGPALSLEARRSLRLTSIDVAFAPEARIHISQLEDEVTARGLGPAQVAEAERAQIKTAIASEFMGRVAPGLNNGRAVIARVTVRNFNVPGPVAAMVSGGSSSLSAGVDLVDAKTGEMLVSIPPGKIVSSVYRPGGVLGVAVQAAAAGDPSEIKTREMAREFADEYARWILQG